jgi:hypothetical protein
LTRVHQLIDKPHTEGIEVGGSGFVHVGRRRDGANIEIAQDPSKRQW